MNLFENLKQYILGITVTNGICIVAIKIKPEWVIPPSNLVGVDINPNTNTTSLYGIDPSITLDTVLERLDIIVKMGIENEEKTELFNLKIKELDNLFSNNSLEELKSLSFVFKGLEDVTNEQKSGHESYQTPIVVEEIKESMVEKQEIIFDPTAQENNYSFDEMAQYEDMTLSEIAALKKG